MASKIKKISCQSSAVITSPVINKQPDCITDHFKSPLNTCLCMLYSSTMEHSIFSYSLCNTQCKIQEAAAFGLQFRERMNK